MQNPMHCIPAMDDDGFTMWESKAILRYVANKHSLEDWYDECMDNIPAATPALYTLTFTSIEQCLRCRKSRESESWRFCTDAV